MSTSLIAEIEVWEPDDLTVVAGAGVQVAELERVLSGKDQTAVLPELPGPSTLGGVLATGRSSLRRGRLLGTRERVLEITAVTGDGRVVRSGGRVVKNVSGYDLHRAHVGAMGSLGVIVTVCLKLWPTPSSGVTIRLKDVSAAQAIQRPLAVLETREGVDLFLWGTEAETTDAASRVDGDAQPGLHWPDDPMGAFRWSLRVAPALTAEAVSRVGAWRFLAVHGIGEVRLASDTTEGAQDLRKWAESTGGSLVLVHHPGDSPPMDPWGTSPDTIAIHRRLVGEFDPARIINPNRLPGGV